MATQRNYHTENGGSMTFGERIRELRKREGLTLRELASLVGIDFTYLSKIENDYGAPPAESTIRKLAHVLNADADAEELVLLANKLPEAFERDLLSRPESQVAELYRSMAGKRYSDDDWKAILKQLREKGTKK